MAEKSPYRHPGQGHNYCQILCCPVTVTQNVTAVLIGVRFHSPLPPRYGTVPVMLNSLPFTNLSNGQIYRVGVNCVSRDGVGRDLIRCGSCAQGMCAVHTWGNYMAS